MTVAAAALRIEDAQVREASPSAWTIAVRMTGAGAPGARVLSIADFDLHWVDIVPSSLTLISAARDSKHEDTYVLRVVSEVPVMGARALMRIGVGSSSIPLYVASGIDGDEQSGEADYAGTTMEVDYLAKDFTSFRRTIFDVLTQRVPLWTERHTADELVAVAEVLAYAGDYLSAYQDAVATEAYLSTARLRTSVRRHARLLDYHLLEGCAARVWLHFTVNEDAVPVPIGLRVAGTIDEPTLKPPYVDERLLSSRSPVFTTLESGLMYERFNVMAFYTGGSDDDTRVLPRGSTSALLEGDMTELEAGDVLVFEELRGVLTGSADDRRQSRRHAVRLTQKPELLANTEGATCTRIVWFPGDATPFDFTICARDVAGELHRDVTVVRGNILPAEEGKDASIDGKPEEFTVGSDSSAFRPQLQFPDITFVVPYDSQTARGQSAGELGNIDARCAVPSIDLSAQEPDSVQLTWWQSRGSLLDSSAFDRAFVVEVQNDRFATLRFGDDVHGRRPLPGTKFEASYRTAAREADVGPDVLRTIVLNKFTSYDQRITGVRNPLPALGGVAPENLEHARRYAPLAYRTQHRCVVPEDFSAAARVHPGVQNAVVERTWSGAQTLTMLYVQAVTPGTEDPALLGAVYRQISPLVVAGERVYVSACRYVPIAIRMRIAVHPAYSATVVAQAVKRALLKCAQDAGFTFGQPVYASPFVAASLNVRGVLDAAIAYFGRNGRAQYDEKASGVIAIGATEIAQLDDDTVPGVTIEAVVRADG